MTNLPTFLANKITCWLHIVYTSVPIFCSSHLGKEWVVSKLQHQTIPLLLTTLDQFWTRKTLLSFQSHYNLFVFIISVLRTWRMCCSFDGVIQEKWCSFMSCNWFLLHENQHRGMWKGSSYTWIPCWSVFDYGQISIETATHSLFTIHAINPFFFLHNFQYRGPLEPAAKFDEKQWAPATHQHDLGVWANILALLYFVGTFF